MENKQQNGKYKSYSKITLNVNETNTPIKKKVTVVRLD